MNRVARLFICIVGGVALSVTARGSTTPATPNVNAFQQNVNTNLLNRMMMLKKHRHIQNPPPGFSQFPGPGASQPNVPQTKATQSNFRQPYKNINAADFRPKTATTPAAPTVAAEPSASGNPYESIVTRNVFGLNPIPPDAPAPQTPPGPPPPKITLTGIMTIFGPAEALFKVAGVVREHGQPHDESYIFTEGEMQDEVQVTRIDTNKMVVSFMNHGVQQDIGLTEGTASTGTAPSAPTFPGQPRMRKFGRFGAMGGNPGGFQTQSYSNPYGGGGNNNGSQNGNNGVFNGNGQQSNYHNLNSNISPAISQLSDEDQQALVAAAHAQAAQQNDPNMPPMIFPPTKFDPEAMKEMGGGGNPNPGGK